MKKSQVLRNENGLKTTTTTTKKKNLAKSSIISGIIKSLSCLRNMEGFYMMIFTKKPEALTMSRGNKGFTLAEVLITLGIIGVVAAMTIPTLIENNQKTQYVTGLKKAYTNFNQVLVQYSADNGCVGDLACTGLFQGGNDAASAAAAEKLAPYFNIAKQCGIGVSGCFPAKVSYNFDGSGVRDDSWNTATVGSKFITQDGIAFLIKSDSTNCGEIFSRGVTGDMKQYCGTIFVDVNGNKGPNNFGRDIFYFNITNGRGPKLYPVGGQDDMIMRPWNDQDDNGTIDPPADWQCNGSIIDGWACAGRIMDEGWEMNY